MWKGFGVLEWKTRWFIADPLSFGDKLWSSTKILLMPFCSCWLLDLKNPDLGVAATPLFSLLKQLLQEFLGKIE